MSLALRDARGRTHALPGPPRRIVSLVPSWTETLCALGGGDRLAGVTDFCIHPAEALARVPRVGGTKNPDVERILALEPDVVVANREENRRRSVEALEAAGIPVLVTWARTVSEAIDEIRLLGRLLDADQPAERLLAPIASALERAAASRIGEPLRVIALIWKDPYMAVGADTFAHDLLRCAGGRNAAAGREGRYPRLIPPDLVTLAPDVILLPTEPYRFGEPDRRGWLASDTPAGRARRVHVIEGELLTWYGPRMARALDVLTALLRHAPVGRDPIP